MSDKTPMEMFNELIRMGFVVPAATEPSDLMEPTAYITVPTSLAFVTPPIPPLIPEEKHQDAALGQRPKGNPKGKRRPRHR